VGRYGRMIFNYKHAPNLVATWRKEALKAAPGIISMPPPPPADAALSVSPYDQFRLVCSAYTISACVLEPHEHFNLTGVG
jgi:hypothetical protein